MQPKGFWSYARGDDAHLDGVLTSLRKRLGGEVSMLLGHDVDIFQDIHDLRTGDRWADKLRGELTRAAFLIPVLSPRFFYRDWCREETLTFLRLASENGVTPLVFPIRFVEYDDDESCEVQVALRPFQYEDFSQWRFESDPTAKARLENGFARDVKDQLKLPRKPAPKTVAAPDRVREKPAPISDTAEAQAPARPTPRKVVQELVVDQWPDDGDHSTISAAIKAAKPGARILIRPGTYTENLVLDKPLELIGEGERDEVLVAVTSGNALQVSASLGLVRNMRFLRGQGKGNNVAAWVTAGRCVFEDCSFTSRSLSAVHVKGAGTAPGFDRCRFEGSAQGGASVLDHATPRFEECRFSDNDLHGIWIVEKADPELRRCVMRQNTQVGAFVYEDGRGRFTDCDFAQNGFDGVATKEGGAPHLKNCRLIDNQQWGFRTEDKDGGGTVEDCLFRGNVHGAWRLTEGSEGWVVRRDNREE